MITVPDAVRRKALEAGCARARRLAELSGLDPMAIWERSVVVRSPAVPATIATLA